MNTIVTGSPCRTSMPILFAINKHCTNIMILRNSRLILQTAVQLSFVIGSIIVADTHVVGNIVTSNILSRLKIISSSGWSISSFLKIVTKAQSIIDMGSKAFKDIPVQINTSVQLLTSLLRIATVKKSMNIFAISHNTSITTSHGIIRSYTRNRILHITTSGIAGIVVCNTIGITTISKFRPITIKTSTHFHIIEHIIVIIETSIITLKIVFHLNALFIHHTDRYVKIRLVVSTGC